MNVTRRKIVSSIAIGSVFPFAVIAQKSALVNIWINVFIPKSIDGLTKNAGGEFADHTMIKGPIPGVSDCFLTDNRSFSQDASASSRMHSNCLIDIQNSKIVKQLHRCDPTVEIDCEDFSVECKSSASAASMKFEALIKSNGKLEIPYSGSSKNGCFSGSPSIDITGTITIDPIGQILSFDGNCEPFPAFEMYTSINNGPTLTLFQREPNVGSSPWNLPGDPNQKISGQVSY